MNGQIDAYRELKAQFKKLEEDFNKHSVDFKLQAQREQFWRYIILGVAALSNVDAAESLLKTLLKALLA